MLLYIDDIIITGNNSAYIAQLIASLSTIFELKDLGSLNYFLGIQISHSEFGVTLTQSKYAFDILYRFHMENSKPTKTPYYPSTKLLPSDGVSLFDPIEYRSMVSALQYLTFTCHDLAFIFHQPCKFMSRPTSNHLKATKRVLWYFRGILHHGISFTPGPWTLIAFLDVDWVGDPTDRCLTTGLCVSWSLSYFMVY